MKKLSVRYSVYLFVLLSMLLLVGCTGLREVTSTDETEIIVFQTGSTWLAITLHIFPVLIGLSGLLLGIMVVWVAKDFIKESKKLKGLGVFFFGLLLVSSGVFFLGTALFWWSYSERITFDRGSMTMEVEKKYILRHESYRLAFADISHVKYQAGRRSAGQYGGDVPYGEVTLVLSDGREIELSKDGQKSQHKLAQRISELTQRKLIEEYR